MLLAAIRLAAFYAAGVVCLLLFLGSLLEGPPPLRVLTYLAGPFGFFFLLASLILAVARRAGFAALWTLLAALWIWMVRESELSIDAPRIFLFWTALAMPLFLIGALGSSVGPVTSSTFLRVPRPVLISILWVVLAILALVATAGTMSLQFYEDPDRLINTLGRLVWIPVPLAFSAIELIRVWRATSPTTSEASAA